MKSRQVPKIGNTMHEIPPIKYNPIDLLYGQAGGLSIIHVFKRAYNRLKISGDTLDKS